MKVIPVADDEAGKRLQLLSPCCIQQVLDRMVSRPCLL